MPVVNFLINVVNAITKPFKHVDRSPNQKPKHQHFYEHGFMADEIKALQSIFHSEDRQRSQKNK